MCLLYNLSNKFGEFTIFLLILDNTWDCGGLHNLNTFRRRNSSHLSNADTLGYTILCAFNLLGVPPLTTHVILVQSDPKF